MIGLWDLTVFGIAISQALPSLSEYSDDDCGEINKAAWYLTSDTQSAAELLPKYPWHVGLHIKTGDDDKWIQKCSGSLIRPNLVLTAAHCLYHRSRGELKRRKFRDILITAGKNKRSFYDKEPYQQSSKPLNFTAHPLYSEQQDSQDIAIIELRNPFVISDYVRPICIKLLKNYQLEKIPATIVGWNLIRVEYKNGQNLLEAKLPLANCHKVVKQAENTELKPAFKPFYTQDRFCAFHYNAIAPGRGDSGAGVAVQEGKKWYIYGIVSQGDHGFIFTVFTEVNYHLKFIGVTLKQIDERRTQITPKHNDTICDLPHQPVECLYKVTSACQNECVKRAGERVADGDKVLMRCKDGFTPSDDRMQYACLKGNWFHENPRCIKLCEPLRKKNMEVKCGYEFRKIDCNGYVRPGTLAYYSCDKFYSVADPFPFIGVAECLENGTWNQTLPDCVPDGCGFLNKAASNATPAIAYGFRVKSVLEYPWHVGLHNKDNSTQKWVQNCAGSLIRPNIVLTAAHCVHDPNSQVRINSEDVLVTAGKYKRDFYDLEEYQQSSLADKIVVPALYSGFATHYQEDIAIVVLKSSFVINDYVRHFVGWGFTEHKLSNLGRTGTPSDVLLKTELPIMDLIQCRKQIEQLHDSYFFPYLTSDKMCGRYINGSGPQLGDSGGGLVAPDGFRWFLEGVMSLKNGASTFAAFTKVHAHLNFIKDAMRTTGIASPDVDDLPYHKGWVYK
ncbi:hypothetical protein GE061_002061 [Apolygus lucorum]|uniref:Peptidase S1 domain-containing protein n=1 Tax=Apolygus lucorum TaxID=248454 RepID=A0A8S9X423_APOLU|nr:hypothetical protein GE061_002061 [Apolygus lucorum]